MHVELDLRASLNQVARAVGENVPSLAQRVLAKRLSNCRRLQKNGRVCVVNLCQLLPMSTAKNDTPRPSRNIERNLVGPRRAHRPSGWTAASSVAVPPWK